MHIILRISIEAPKSENAGLSLVSQAVKCGQEFVCSPQRDSKDYVAKWLEE